MNLRKTIGNWRWWVAMPVMLLMTMLLAVFTAAKWMGLALVAAGSLLEHWLPHVILDKVSGFIRKG